MYRLVLLKFTPFTPLARQPNNTNLKSDDSDDENFTAKMYSGSFQT